MPASDSNNRESQMSAKSLSFFVSAIAATLFGMCAKAETPVLTKPTPEQVAWADAELGVIFHFDMPTFVPGYNWRNWGSHPPASAFNPSALDTDQWIRSAKAMGATYAVLVAKHCSGFSLWPTKAHDYNVSKSPYKGGKGDIVGEFIASCRKYGLKPGIYASTTANGYLWVNNPGRVQKGSPLTQEEYNRVVETQLTELWSNYGELFEIWFDGGVLSRKEGGADVLALVRKLQPKAIAFQGSHGHPNLVRWVGNEHGTAPYPCWGTAAEGTRADGTKEVVGGNTGVPDGSLWCPGEADCTLRHNGSFQGGWFWRKGEDHRLFTVPELMRKYSTSVGRNTNMLLGIVVDDRGLVPDADAQRMAEFGKAIQARWGKPEKTLSGKGRSFEMRFKQPLETDRVILQEDIADGERIQSYELKGLVGDRWETLAKGSCVGHKRIEEFEPRTVTALRLEVTSAKAEPHLRTFSVFRK